MARLIVGCRRLANPPVSTSAVIPGSVEAAAGFGGKVQTFGHERKPLGRQVLPVAPSACRFLFVPGLGQAQASPVRLAGVAIHSSGFIRSTPSLSVGNWVSNPDRIQFLRDPVDGVPVLTVQLAGVVQKVVIGTSDTQECRTVIVGNNLLNSALHFKIVSSEDFIVSKKATYSILDDAGDT